MILQIKQAPNTAGVYEKKQEFLDNWNDCVKVRKIDGAYWYLIHVDSILDEDLESMAMDIRGTISEEDYRLYFDPETPSDALGNLSEGLQEALKQQKPVSILADISFKQQIASDRYLLELTCGDGSERIRAIATAEQCGHHTLAEDYKVFVTGHWSFEKERGTLELIVDYLYPTVKFADTSEILSTQKKMIRFYEGRETKRSPYPIENQIAGWNTLAVLTNESKTAEDFQRILASKKSELACKTMFVRFSGEALAAKIEEIGKGSKYSAICIIKGQPRDKYTVLPLNSYKSYEEIGGTDIPVLVGVGRDEDRPYGLEDADYIASTYSALAVQIATWQNFKAYEKKHGLFSNFFGFFRKCLPW